MKLKIMAIITAIILIVSYVPVYADTTIPDLPSDVMEYWVIYYYPSNVIFIMTSNNPLTVNKTGDRVYAEGGYREYKYEENGWRIYNEGTSVSTGIGTICASNHDIAYKDGSGFFFLRPKVSPLFQTMEGTDFGAILRNFSAGLIPLIGCLILGISLVKAWGFLRTQLKH